MDMQFEVELEKQVTQHTEESNNDQLVITGDGIQPPHGDTSDQQEEVQSTLVQKIKNYRGLVELTYVMNFWMTSASKE